jgi:hypothetical protein
VNIKQAEDSNLVDATAPEQHIIETATLERGVEKVLVG